ncbi:uncharacterized protein [Prorops nasuta]|uniref:uncharacterized protein isoform X1 n=1 Tax=Prorops nasuta TaxID=863751 RepID=UPI0034CE2E4F
MSREFENRFRLIKTENEYFKWAQECHDYIQRLRSDNPKVSSEIRMKYLAEIETVKSLLLKALKNNKSAVKIGSSFNVIQFGQFKSKELKNRFRLIKTDHEHRLWVRECRTYIRKLRFDSRKAPPDIRVKYLVEIENVKSLLLKELKDNKSAVKRSSASDATCTFRHFKSKELKNRYGLIKTNDQYRSWVRECRAYIKILKNPGGGISPKTRKKNFAEIARVKRLLLQSLKDKSKIQVGSASNGTAAEPLVWAEFVEAVNNGIASGIIINNDHIEPTDFLSEAEELIHARVNKELSDLNRIIINCVFNAELIYKNISCDIHISTTNNALTKTDNFSQWYKTNIIEMILKSLREFHGRENGWSLTKILNLVVNINNSNSMRVGCKIQLPLEIKKKKAVLNIKTHKDDCFAWALTAAFYPSRTNNNTTRPGSYPHYTHVFNIRNITFPVTLNQVSKFEMDNNVSINVFTMVEEELQVGKRVWIIVPLQVTKKKRSRHANLLMILDDQDTAHFVCIRYISRLITKQLGGNGRPTYICDRCLRYFFTAKRFQLHESYCVQLNDNNHVVHCANWIH